MSTARKYDDVELPEGWRTVRLDAIADVIGGSTPSRDRDEFWGGSIPWVVPSEITSLSGRCLTYTNECITEAGLQAAGLKILPAGSVLLTSRATIGAAAINTRPVATNQGFQNLVAKDGTNSLWLYYCISSMRRELDRRAAGSTFAEISRDNVRSLPILYPPLPEQRAIADVLDSIDEAIECTESVIAASETLRDSLLHELLTRGVPGWHTNWKDVPGIGTIPADWVVVQLGEVIETSTYGTNEPLGDNGNIVVLRMNNIQRGEIDWSEVKRAELSERELNELGLGPGDILFNRTNSLDLVGKIAMVRNLPEPTSFASYLVRMRTKVKIASPVWLSTLLGSTGYQSRIRRFATPGVSQANINPTNLKSLTIPLPSISEQAIVVAVLDGIREQVQHARREHETLRQAKTAIANELLSGQMRARNMATNLA